MTAERTGGSTEPLPHASFEYNYEVEIPVIEAKYVELLKEVNRFQDPAAKDGLSRKLYSRMLHLLNRVNVAPVEGATPEQLHLRSVLREKVSGLLPLLDGAVKTRANWSSLVNLSVVMTSVPLRGEESLSDSEDEVQESPFHVGQSSTRMSAPSVSEVRSVSVHQWGLKFSGEIGGLSVSEF